MICSYLSDRKQKVVINENQSSDMACHVGVLQGSVVGPMLFDLYINDMYKYFDGCDIQVRLYADDALLFMSGKSQSDLIVNMNLALSKLSTYLSTNRVVLIPKKKNFYLILRGTTSFDYIP